MVAEWSRICRASHSDVQVRYQFDPTGPPNFAHGTETIRDLRDVVDARLPDVPLVLDAARIEADRPMAYADAFGAALAVAEGAELWTGDPELLVDEAPWRWVDLRATG